MPTGLERIEHIVVLMMENRSFDHMLGYQSAKHGRPVAGLTGKETNPGPNGPVKVRPLQSTRFEFDVGHSSTDVAQQIADANRGFVANYAAQPSHGDPALVMGYHDETHVWAYESLSRQFAVCDRWHASLPGPTIPNRMFAVAGSSDGDLDNVKPVKFYSMRSVFDALDAGLGGRPKGERWGSYYHDMPMLLLLEQHRDDLSLGGLGNFLLRLFGRRTARIHKIDKFFERAHAGRLPAVSWIDPNFADFGSSNDDHPPKSDLYDGQRLVADVYNALLEAQNDAWSRTLFIVTYDEHGGFYDHVAPPKSGDAAPFDRLGVRVPALVASPFTAPGTIDSVVRDHCSVLRTILARFAPGERLTPRVERAPDLSAVLTLAAPRRDAVPIAIPPRPTPVSDEPPAVRAKLGPSAAQGAATQPDDLEKLVHSYQDELRRLGYPIA